MRKQLKNKKCSCAMCKPHKRGMENHWKPKERQDRKLSEEQIRLLKEIFGDKC